MNRRSLRVAFRPGTSTLAITGSGTGAIFAATLPGRGIPLFSHAWIP